MQHPVETPHGVTHHMRISIEDDCEENIAQYFPDSIAFIEAAHSRNQKVFE